MKIVIHPTLEDGSIRAAAILQTQDALRRALAGCSSQLDHAARLTLVQTSVGIRTLGALLEGAVASEDASARVAQWIVQSRHCGLQQVSEGLHILWRTWEQLQTGEPSRYLAGEV
jgi:hypothetical protein